jgi:hypothetical protein
VVRELVERALESADSDAGAWPFASRALEHGEPLLIAEAEAEFDADRFDPAMRSYAGRGGA